MQTSRAIHAVSAPPTITPPTSPTTTGCSARMAVLAVRGQFSVGDLFTGISLIGLRFHCALAAKTTVADRPAIIPSLPGRAWITGIHQHMPDPADPCPRGYRLSDTWRGAE